MPLTPSQIASEDSAYWAAGFQKIQLSSGRPFSFAEHEYQVEPMQCQAKRKFYMKATGGGFSEIEVLDSIHSCIFGRFPQGVLYLFPTSDNVQEFSQTRFKSLTESNPESIGRFVGNRGKGADKASLKQIGSSFLYLRGARLSQSMEAGLSEKESTLLRGIQVDRVTFDEVGLMDPSAIAKALGRMGHSRLDLKQERYITNPGMPDDAADKAFMQSDQRYWQRRCGCGRWFSADDEFPECVKLGHDGRGYIGCRKCGAAVPFWSGKGTGQWVPKVPANTEYMPGWHWSHLTSNFNDPWEVLQAFINPPQGNLSDVVRLKLGKPHVDAKDKLEPKTVRACCGQDLMCYSHPGPCAMGVDVGVVKHIVIGVRTAREQYEIVKIIALSSWDDILELVGRFHVSCAVIDSMPDLDAARDFQKRLRCQSYLCRYTENAIREPSYDEDQKIVTIDRTQACDATHRLFVEKTITIPRQCSDVDTFVAQVCNPAKVLETNKRTGQNIFRYRGSEDHYRHALNYFSLAVPQIGLASSARGKQQTVAVSDYAILDI